MRAQFGGLGRSGGPSWKARPELATVQCGESIAGFPSVACQIDCDGCMRENLLATINFPVPLNLEAHLEQTVLRVVALATLGTKQVAAPCGASLIVVLSHSKGHPTTARH